MNVLRLAFSFFAISLLFPAPAGASTRSEAAGNLLRLIYRNADETVRMADEAARAADLRLVEQALVRHGPAAEKVLADGGFALLAAARHHGDEVVAAAVRVPEAAPFLAARTSEALQLAKRFGDDGLRVEATVPKLLSARPQLLTRKEVSHLAQLPPEQLRSLVGHLAHVADASTASRLVEAHRIHGPSLLQKIPKRYLVGGGVLTLLMVDIAVNEMRGGDCSRIVEWLRDLITSLLAQLVVLLLAVLLAYALLRRFILALWHKLMGAGKQPSKAGEDSKGS